MTRLRQGIWEAGLARWRRKSPAAALTLVLALAQTQTALAAIVNDAVAGGTYGGVAVVSNISSQSVNVSPATASMTVTKSGVLADIALPAGDSAGYRIDYTVTVTNTGTTSLTGVVVNDPIAPMSLQSGDTNSNSRIDPGEAWVYTGSYLLQQADLDGNGGGDGDIDNTVTVTTNELPAQNASAAVAISGAAGLTVTKSGVLSDIALPLGDSAGDRIDYTVTLANGGTVSLTGVVVSDPLAPMTYQSGDTNSNSAIDPGETWIYTGSYVLQQADLDGNGGGDGDIDNTVTVTTNELAAQNASAAVAIVPVPGIRVEKTLVSTATAFPGIYDVRFRIRVINTGAVELSGIAVDDDLAAALAPAAIVGTPGLTLSGFAGSGGANGSYDGSSDVALLSGDVRVAAGGTGEILLDVRVDANGVQLSGANQASAVSSQIAGPTLSDDPTQTPGDPLDINPTPVAIADSDGDGADDGIESDSADRDGDGVPDASDYDPTGYFYCQANGRIISGALITVENLTLGGSQTGVGTSNDITIVRDGSDGSYQFHVTAAGDYRLSYTLPGGHAQSTTHLPGGPLDLTSLLPSDPAVLGSGEFGSTGRLADFSPAANPFHLDFSIEAGDPHLFNNNIPLLLPSGLPCGEPRLAVKKEVAGKPELLADGRTRVVYEITVENRGTGTVRSLQLEDDLGDVFGNRRFEVQRMRIETGVQGFPRQANPAFDGFRNTQLLGANATLSPGDKVMVQMTLLLDVPAGRYVNRVVATGVSETDGSPLTPARDSVAVVIEAPPAAQDLVVQKNAGSPTVRLGEAVSYTITVTNRSGRDAAGVAIVDQMPPGFSYVANSATIDRRAVEPRRRGNELVWSDRTIPARQSVTLRFSLIAGAAASGTEFVNYAFARDRADGAMISNIAQASVRLEIEPIFQCAEVIGRVYRDLNRDGYPQEDEPGIEGVRLATARGLLVTTDSQGRFHVTCPMIPDEDIGSNFELKLDASTLPDGYGVTSENPRIIRLTRGKLSKMDFGAIGARRVTLELRGEQFEPGGTNLKRETLRTIAQLINYLEEEKSILEIRYLEENGGNLSDQRINATRILLQRAWNAKTRPYELVVESRSRE